MKQFEHCTESELQVFSRIADGQRAETQDPAIVKRLLELNLLGEDQGMITVPVMVWLQWEKFKKNAA